MNNNRTALPRGCAYRYQYGLIGSYTTSPTSIQQCATIWHKAVNPSSSLMKFDSTRSQSWAPPRRRHTNPHLDLASLGYNALKSVPLQFGYTPLLGFGAALTSLGQPLLPHFAQSQLPLLFLGVGDCLPPPNFRLLKPPSGRSRTLPAANKKQEE